MVHEQTDVIAASSTPIALGTARAKAGALSLITPAKGLALQLGSKAFSIHAPSNAAVNPLATGSQQTFFVNPTSIVPDVINKFNLVFSLTNTGGVNPITLACFAASIIVQYEIKVGSSLQQTYRGEALSLQSLLNYSTETWGSRAAQEGVNVAGGYVPATTVIAPGATVQFSIPLWTMMDNAALFVRAMGASAPDLQFTFQFATAASIVTAGTAADLLLSSSQIYAAGYKFTADLRDKLLIEHRGTPYISRVYEPKCQIVSLPNGIQAGTSITTQIGGGLFGLSAAVLHFVRPVNATPAQLIAPVANSTTAWNLLLSSQPLVQFPPNADAVWFRNTFCGAPQVLGGPAITALGLNLACFAVELTRCLSDGCSLGSYFVASTLALQATSGVTNANVELFTMSYNFGLFIQNGSQLSLQTTV